MKSWKWQPADTIIVAHAALIWIGLYAADVGAEFVLRGIAIDERYYYYAIGLASLLFCLMTRLGAKPIVYDIQEICLYDVLVQCGGLYLYIIKAPPTVYLTAAQVMISWKIIRLVWPIFGLHIGLLPHWPPFGIMGLYRRYRFGAANKGVTANKIFLTYLTLFGAPICLFFIQSMPMLQPYPMREIVTLAVLFGGGAHMLISKLDAREIEVKDALLATAAAENRVNLAQIELANKAAIEAKNKELEAALKQRDQANTELASKNTALASANATLEALSQERATLARDLATRNERLADATHDIQQPLMFLGYKANAILASAITDEQRADALELKEELRGLGDRMVRITAEAQTGEMPPPPTLNLPVAELRSYFFERFNSLALDHEVTLKCLIKPDWDANFALQSNGDLLKRVIGNLLYNAITYAEESDWVFLIFHRCGNECFVRIWDTGQGIGDFDSPDRTANFRALLASTKPDTQTEAPSEEHDPVADGHGIGLHSVQRLCEQLGITMTLRTRTDQGTLYRFKLPII